MTTAGILVLIGMIVVSIGLIVLAVIGHYFPPPSIDYTTATFPENTRGRVHGTLRQLEEAPLVAPLSGRPCAYYEAVVEENTTKGWRTRVRESQGQDFLVEDDAGTARVIMRDARVNLVDDAHFVSGILAEPTPTLEAFLHRNGERSTGWFFNKNLRYREGVLEAGELVSVLGHGSREPDPDPRAAMGGYRESAMRLVLSARPDTPLQISDDTGQRGENSKPAASRPGAPPAAGAASE